MLTKKFLERAYFIENKSGRDIAKDTGLTAGQIFSLFKRYAIPMRSKKESTSISSFRHPRLAGVNHWAHGKTKKTSTIHAQSSQRMREINPMHNPETRKKMCATLATTLRKNPTRWEQAVFDLVGKHGAFQFPIGNAIVDFAFLEQKIILEIDGNGHSSAARNRSDIIRDGQLIEQGWVIIRYRQSTDTPPRLTRLVQMLEQFIPDLDISHTLPAFTNDKYGVLIRCKQYPAGIRCNTVDECRIIALTHGR